jgi:hypothetical protein
MARDHKPLQLKPVDDDVKPVPVIRLKNRDTERLVKDDKPVRLGPLAGEAEVSQRLALPSRDEGELRTHQPGIEAIIETEAAAPEVLEENWGENLTHRNPIPWGWFALIGLVITGAVLWSLGRVKTADVQADQIRIATASTLIQDQQKELEARQLIGRIHHNLREFFTASSVDALTPLVRQPERVIPLMRKYYADHPLTAKSLKSPAQLRPITLDDHANFWMAAVILADGTDHQLILEAMESGDVLIDWETMVCYQPMLWDDYVAQRPVGSVLDFRVRVKQDNYYNYEFVDSKRWTCFRLTALDNEQTLFGYAPAGSAIALALLQQIKLNGGLDTALILRLAIPAGLQSRNGVMIEKVLSNRWLYLDPPDAGS